MPISSLCSWGGGEGRCTQAGQDANILSQISQVEPRSAGEWFHCKVLNILWRHFYIWSRKVSPIENCGRFVFYNNIFYFFTKNQKQNNRHCVTFNVISMVYLTTIPRARMGSESIARATDSEAISARGIIVLVKSN